MSLGGTLKAQLYKMLVYEPGQFFVSHQDSEKVANMVGTMTVELPSHYKGGTTIIEHRGEKIAFRRSKHSSEEITFIAFYGDCHHEVKPTTEGYRVVLVYNLLFDEPAGCEEYDNTSPTLSTLEAQIRQHFATPTPTSRYSREATHPPDKLVYLLDHEYSQKSLGWTRLKNADRLGAETLRAVAERCECEIFLALADVHEAWSCDDDGYGWGRRDHWYDDELEEEDDDRQSASEHPPLMDLCDSDMELRHWFDAKGTPVADMSPDISWNEVCFTKDSVDCDPFKSRHEGFMGNYGNTVDRWYHRAAVVMWPRKRSFVIRAKASPEWAMEELWTALRGKRLEEAQVKARELLPSWESTAQRVNNPRFLASTLRVASHLADAELAAALLRPAKLSHLNLACVPHLTSLLATHGLSWSCDLIQQWSQNTNRYAGDIDKEWLRFMPSFCRKLCQTGAEPERTLAQSLVDTQWNHVKKHCESILSGDERPAPQDQLDNAGKRLIDLIASSINTTHAATHTAILDFLGASETSYPLLALLAMLRHAHKTREPAALKALQLGLLHKHSVSCLNIALSTPMRDSNDWSITPPLRSSKELIAFLSAPDRIRLEWPLAKQGRREVHRLLDGYNLPVSHTTRRQGSPYTLVLVKTKALFAREAELRSAMKADLKWLKAMQRCF